MSNRIKAFLFFYPMYFFSLYRVPRYPRREWRQDRMEIIRAGWIEGILQMWGGVLPSQYVVRTMYICGPCTNYPTLMYPLALFPPNPNSRLSICESAFAFILFWSAASRLCELCLSPRDLLIADAPAVNQFTSSHWSLVRKHISYLCFILLF